ncbi:phosphotransferase enzyme family protein [Candidatus Latescibacterota bacterium]
MAIDRPPRVDVLRTHVLARYELAEPVTCVLHHSGCNHTYQVETGRERYYLRVYRRNWRRRAQIQAEVDMLNHLARQGQPVSAPLPRHDERYVTRITCPEGVRYAVLFPEARSDQAMTVSGHRPYGELVARIHGALDSCPMDGRRPCLDEVHLIDQPLKVIRPHLRHRGRDWDCLRGLCQDFRASLGGLLPRHLPEYGWCHGDIPNVHVDSDGGMTLFDFDCCGYGWRACDIAVVWWLWSWVAHQQDWSRGRVSRRWGSFLDGYCAARALSSAELEATKLFVAIRHIWLMGLQIEMSTTHGVPGMRIDDGYLRRNLEFVKGWAARHRLA